MQQEGRIENLFAFARTNVIRRVSDMEYTISSTEVSVRKKGGGNNE